MGSKTFVNKFALTKYTTTLSNIYIISYIKKSTFLHQIIFNSKPIPALQLNLFRNGKGLKGGHPNFSYKKISNWQKTGISSVLRGGQNT